MKGVLTRRRLGVGVAGAMDVSAMHSANRIVGNPTPTPVIEVLNGGLKAKMHQVRSGVAVTGASGRFSDVKFSDGRKDRL